MKKYTYLLLLSLSLSLYAPFTFAWCHSIELGYGYSHDTNHTQYNNSGVMLNGDLFPIWMPPMMRWSINASIGRWWTTAPHYRNLSTAALDLVVRFYPFQYNTTSNIAPYFMLASGPAWLSSHRFGENTEDFNWAFQSNIGFGVELWDKIDVNLRWQHYSNANIGRPNEGFNILYLLSIGYLF